MLLFLTAFCARWTSGLGVERVNAQQTFWRGDNTIMCIMTIIAIAENVRLVEICIIRMEIIERYQDEILDEQSHGVSKGEHQFKRRNDLRLFSLYCFVMFCYYDCCLATDYELSIVIHWLALCQLEVVVWTAISTKLDLSTPISLLSKFSWGFSSTLIFLSYQTVIILEDDR